MIVSKRLTHESQTSNPSMWVDRHGDALYRYAMLYVRDVATAEDLVQDALLAALKAHDRFEERSAERTWLIGILRHKVLDFFRRAARAPGERASGIELAEAAEPFNSKGHWKSKPLAWPHDPSHTMESDQFWATFRECLSTVPPGAREAFCLIEVEGLSPETVREVFAISATNLWSRLHRARMLLRRCLENNWFERIRRAPKGAESR